MCNHESIMMNAGYFRREESVLWCALDYATASAPMHVMPRYCHSKIKIADESSVPAFSGAEITRLTH
jgi:hypothetical protein